MCFDSVSTSLAVLFLKKGHMEVEFFTSIWRIYRYFWEIAGHWQISKQFFDTE